MTTLALALVFASAFLHATWNLLSKRARGGAEFVWLFASLTVLVYAPFVAAYALVFKPALTWTHVLLAAVSSVLHILYFVFLQRGYRLGDLSLVYPTARGSGPALATALAILVLGERPGLQALLGTLLVVASVFVLAGGKAGGRRSRPAVGYGLLTGLFIGVYTVFDGYAVRHAGVTPLVFTYLGEVGRALLLLPFAFRRPAVVRRLWREHKREAIGIATLSPLAYILVLTAMQFTPVSLVAPAREVSILIATFFGLRLLAEGNVRRRALGAVGMVAGVALLALA
ncbi:MAG: DMT family transporter [Trueperaceae bacterium]|nr:DMT family transporter [Trueperaceae bacterium]